MATAYKFDITQALLHGGQVRFTWKNCRTTLLLADGTEHEIDGRAYRGFLQTIAPTLSRRDAGSTDTGDLVITWLRST